MPWNMSTYFNECAFVVIFMAGPVFLHRSAWSRGTWSTRLPVLLLMGAFQRLHWTMNICTVGAGKAPWWRWAHTLVPLAGVAGEDGMDVQLWLLWLALELERVGEAAREDGLDLRPRDRKGVIPWDAPSGRMNFSLSSMLVLPRAKKGINTDTMSVNHKKYVFDGYIAAWLHGKFSKLWISIMFRSF